ncbi:MAG: PD40 domain-containing protein [Candidatus Hydrogenedentes bacterium]|nr:PD40 domain-containing protein [Candidatus Hydrogenedentota bacterium]
MRKAIACVVAIVSALAALAAYGGEASTGGDPVAQLAAELHDKGWIAFAAPGTGGAWDIFLARPDGSDRRNLTNTPDFEEVAPRFSPDSTKMLYRRLAKGTQLDHDKWGFQGQLVIAEPDGGNPIVFGDEGEFPWASWSPDGKRVVCLDKKGIEVVDLATKEIVERYPRQGIYQQLCWAPDGAWFCGVANHGGASWTVVRVNAKSGELNPVRSYQNCTPDWFPDSRHIILSSRPAGQPGAEGYGYTQLWMVSGDGQEQRLVYGEDGFHIYGGALSPDARYVAFTRFPKDGSGAAYGGAPLCIMRMADAPSIGGLSPDLRRLHPDTKDGPILVLDPAWEPHWTYADVGGDR